MDTKHTKPPVFIHAGLRSGHAWKLEHCGQVIAIVGGDTWANMEANAHLYANAAILLVDLQTAILRMEAMHEQLTAARLGVKHQHTLDVIRDCKRTVDQVINYKCILKPID